MATYDGFVNVDIRVAIAFEVAFGDHPVKKSKNYV